MSLLKRYLEIPLDKLVSAQWNYKKSDDKRSVELMTKLKNNLVRNDQIENLIIREAKAKGFYEVVNGNHRLTALKEIGKKKAVCFNLGKITLAHAERIAIETNETKFEADPIKFAEIIEGLTKEFDMSELVDTMPLSQEELENYTKLLKFDWSQYEKDLDDLGDKDGGDSEGSDGEEWETIELRLPLGVAELFHVQLDRFKKALNPGRNIEEVSNVTPIECMVAHLAEIPTEMLTGD